MGSGSRTRRSQWVGDAGLPYCEGDDCLVLLEASAAEGCP